MTDSDIARWRGYARQCAIGIGLKRDDVEDAAQEALLRLLEAWSRPQGDPDAYHTRIVANAVRMFARAARCVGRQTENLDGIEEPAAPNPYEAVDRALDARAELRDIAEGIRALSPRQRDVMTLLADGHTPEEIAVKLGTSAGSVHWSTWAARQRLSRRS